MATKPSTAPPVFANLLNYAVDPLVPVALQGTATKVSPIAIRTDNGQIPSVPPFAQNENFILNLETLWSIWVSEGREIKQLDPHIQETNEDGRLFAIGADLGLFATSAEKALEVRPNTLQGASDHGMLCETQIGSPANAALFQDTQLADPQIALEVRCHGAGSKAPFQIDAAFDAGSGVGDRPGMSIASNNPIGRGALELNPIRSTALRIRQSGTGLGAPVIDVQTGDSSTPIFAKQLSGNQPAARLEAFDGGANANAPLLLVPQIFDVAGSGAQSGSIWMHKFFDTVDHFGIQAYMGNSTRHIVHTRQPFCHARGESLPIVVSDADPLIFKALTTFGFPDDLVPHEAGNVRFQVIGRVRRSVTSAAIAAGGGLVLQLIDVTGPPANDVIKTWTRDLPSTSGEANDLFVDFVAVIDFPLKAAGQRTFRVEFKKAATETNALVIEVEDIYATVDALP